MTANTPFYVGQQAQVTVIQSYWADDPDRPGQRDARIRIYEDRITEVEIVKIAVKYVYVKGLHTSSFDKVRFDKVTGEAKTSFYYGGALLETPGAYVDRKTRESSRAAALGAMRDALNGLDGGRRRFQERIGTAQYDAIALALGEWRLTPDQLKLLNEIWQRLTPAEQEVWETLLDYLPDKAKEA